MPNFLTLNLINLNYFYYTVKQSDIHTQKKFLVPGWNLVA